MFVLGALFLPIGYCHRWFVHGGWEWREQPFFFARLCLESACRYKSVCVDFCIHRGIPTWYTETVHSISNPGQTEVYVPDSRVSNHQLHPEGVDRFSPWNGIFSHLDMAICPRRLHWSYLITQVQCIDVRFIETEWTFLSCRIIWAPFWKLLELKTQNKHKNGPTQSTGLQLSSWLQQVYHLHRIHAHKVWHLLKWVQ